MGAVDVHLDTGLGVDLAVGVATEVVTAIEDQDLQAQLVRATLGDGQAEESSTDDDEIRVHTLSWGCLRAFAPAGIRGSRARARARRV